MHFGMKIEIELSYFLIFSQTLYNFLNGKKICMKIEITESLRKLNINCNYYFKGYVLKKLLEFNLDEHLAIKF